MSRERIGNRIKELRQKRGISTYRLAEMTGLQRQNITRIEMGKYSTGIDILSKIAAALGCDLDFVETGWQRCDKDAATHFVPLPEIDETEIKGSTIRQFDYYANTWSVVLPLKIEHFEEYSTHFKKIEFFIKN